MKKIAIFLIGLTMAGGAHAIIGETYEKADIQPCEGEEYRHLSCTRVGAVVNGTVVEYYENGDLKFETPYRGGQKHGLAREYYENPVTGLPRHIKTETNYEYGKNIMVKTYYESGSIRMIMNHETGHFQDYKEDGKLRSERMK